MTFVSLTHASRQLGIDAKTLHRWLAQAPFALQAHPRDARLKGLSGEQLGELARTHHRRLLDQPDHPPAAEPGPGLCADLLALPETLSGLQAQLTALQQQVAALTVLLQQAVASPVSTGEGPLLTGETLASPPATPAPTPPAKPRHVLPLVEFTQQGRYVVIDPQEGLLPFEPEGPAWLAWLATHTAFRFVGQHGRFTAHREVERLPNAVWRAHRKVRNHTFNLRLAHTPHLTIAMLEQAAAALQAHLA